MIASLFASSKVGTAFSLIELLVVITILILLMAFAIPATTSIGASYTVTRQGQLLNDQIVLARQIATSRNRDTELRLIKKSTNGETLWAFQIWELPLAGNSPMPVGQRQAFAENVAMNPALSPLLADLPSTVSGEETFWSLRFRPNGRLAGQISKTNSYLTIQPARAPAGNPNNYFTLQINPITGRVSIYRP